MTIHLSIGTGDLSLTRTITSGSADDIQAQVAAIVARLLAMAAALEKVPA